MEDQSESIMKDMEETRSSLTNKLEALETHVAETIQPVTAAVERVSEAAADIVEDVKETVHEVTEKVENTVQSFSSAFNLQKQFEAHPWMMFGMAATAGCVFASIFTRRTPHVEEAHASSGRSKHAKSGNGWAHRGETHEKPARKSETSGHEGLFAEELRHLKDLAIGALLGAVRELAKRGLPEVLGTKIAEEVDSLTSRMGVQPIQGNVLGDALESSSSQPEQKRERKGARAPESSERRPTSEINRLQSTGSDVDLY